MHAGYKKRKKIKVFEKFENKFLTFWPNFSKNWPKMLKSEKNQTFEKVIFDAKNVLLGPKLLLGDIFWPKIKEKTTFLKFWK